MAEMIHIRLDEKIRKEMKQVVKNNIFSNESEFIRDAIRNNIEKYKKIKLLENFRNQLDEKPTKSTTSNVFREFGIE